MGLGLPIVGIELSLLLSREEVKALLEAPRKKTECFGHLELSRLSCCFASLVFYFPPNPLTARNLNYQRTVDTTKPSVVDPTHKIHYQASARDTRVCGNCWQRV